MNKINSEGEDVTTSVYLHSTNSRILNSEQVDEEYEESVNDVHHKLGLYMGEASGWVLDEIENVYLNISSYKAIRGSCHIDTPTSIKHKRATINVDNKDKDVLNMPY